MVRSWATSGVDLHLDRSGPRLRDGLERALREAIREGRLTPGTRLPSSRALAADLGIARNTVADGYGQLVAEGWLVARRGSGTIVAPRTQGTGARIAEDRAGGGPPTPVAPPGPPARRHDLRAGFPDVAAFPRSAWLSAVRRALADAPADAFSYGDPRGRPELRAAVAEYVARTRGVRTGPDRIVICAGFTQGLGLLAAALRGGGATTVAVESHGVREHRAIIRDAGLSLRALPVDGGGARVDRGRLRGVDAALLTPAHQFPLGAALAPDRRTEVVRWARETGALVVEDDYDGEFRYDRTPVGAMQALDPERVVYAGTAAKALAPGVRLGWLALPATLVEPVADAQAAALRSLGATDQLALARLIADGGYDRHVRRQRLRYRRRRDRLVAMLAREAPAAQVTGIAAGLHVVVRLPAGRSERALVAAAARRGLAIEALRDYAMPHQRAPGEALVVGFGTPPEHAYTAAVARLAAVLRDPGSASDGA